MPKKIKWLQTHMGIIQKGQDHIDGNNPSPNILVIKCECPKSKNGQKKKTSLN